MRMTGIEPAHRTILEPKSSASASSATSAYPIGHPVPPHPQANTTLTYNKKIVNLS